MSDPYIGEIRLFAGNFAPVGWALCQGQLMPISENDALFNLIGTTFGGDGQSNFGLPDLQGRVPVHRSASMTVGEMAGVESVTLNTNQVAAHAHAFQATSALANQPTPGGNLPAQSGTMQWYLADAPTTQLSPDALLPFQGGNQPHENMPPYLVLNYIISLFGIFPTPT
jgi:microcystin-dependent protein